jgi:hypothetical protein
LPFSSALPARFRSLRGRRTGVIRRSGRLEPLFPSRSRRRRALNGLTTHILSLALNNTVLKFLNKTDDASVLLYMFGLGFNFGALPVYGTPEPAEK